MPTSNEANVVLIRRALHTLNHDTPDACARLLTPDFIINLAGVPQMRGCDVWKHGVEMMRRAFPDLRVHVEDIFGSEDRVAVRLKLRGTHTGDFQGIPASGRAIEYTSIEIYRIQDGLIAEEWICSDMATLMQQISGSSSAEAGR